MDTEQLERPYGGGRSLRPFKTMLKGISVGFYSEVFYYGSAVGSCALKTQLSAQKEPCLLSEE